VAVVVEDECGDPAGAALSHNAFAPPALDDAPERSFECKRAALAVLALLGAQADDAGALIDVVPFQREDFAASPPAEVREPTRVLQVVRQVRDDAFEFVVLEEPLARVLLR